MVVVVEAPHAVCTEPRAVRPMSKEFLTISTFVFIIQLVPKVNGGGKSKTKPVIRDDAGAIKVEKNDGGRRRRSVIPQITTKLIIALLFPCV